jgi:hypothetical protein
MLIEPTGNLLEEANKKLKETSAKLSRFSCGNFDWLAQLKGKFNKEALMNYVTDLSESALAAAPMALLATWSPTLYEIVKWLRMFAEGELDLQAASCQRMEAAMADIGQRTTRGAGYPECMKAHKDIDYTKANKICNPGGADSAFDGLEDSMGKLKGLTMPAQRYDVVAEGSKSYMDSTTTGSTAMSVNNANAALAAAQAQLDANPLPPTPAPTDEAGFADYMDKLDAHNSAQKAYDAALASQQRLANSPDQSLWNTMQYGIAKNAASLFGKISISGHGDLDLGTQSKYKIMIFVNYNGYKHQNELKPYLEQHWKIISDHMAGNNVYSSTDLRQSYEAVMIYAMATMGLKGKNPDEFCDESTIDKVACLLYISQHFDGDVEVGASFENQYQIGAFLRNLSCYEVAHFCREKWEKEKPKLLASIKSRITGGQNPQMNNVAKAVDDNARMLDDAYKELEAEWREKLLPTLATVNSFVYKFDYHRQAGRGQKVYKADTDTTQFYTP